MKKHFRPILYCLAFFLLVALFQNYANAIPAFARKYNLKCTTCHTAFPKLNAAGRKFKINGFRLDEEIAGEVQHNMKIADDLQLEKSFPISAIIKGYVYDKKKNSDSKTRPLHEVELQIGGNIFKNVSFFTEIAAEDENDFSPEVEVGAVGFHLSPYINILGGYGPYFFSDPYDTLADWGRRMTRAHKAPWDITNSYASGVRLRKSTQFISLYGNTSGFYYSVGYHRDLGDPEGEGGGDVSARAAYEFTPEFGDTAANISVGGFGVFGQQGAGDSGVDFSRAGFDLQTEVGDSFNLLFVYLMSRDDLSPGIEEKNNSFYGEAFWVFYNKSFSPSFVPLLRIEKYEKDNGALSYTDLVLNLSYYLTQNMKLSLELWSNLSTPSGLEKKNRITAFFTFLL